MKTKYKTHWYGVKCAAHMRLERTSFSEQVTCLICLYHMGLYVPLVRLRDHQQDQIALSNLPEVPRGALMGLAEELAARP